MSQFYPVILKPSVKSKVAIDYRSHVKKHRKQGPSELVAFGRIVALGLKDIHVNYCVNLEGHKFEPDLVYINREKNVYVDIEIDEPYSASGKPTHYVYDSYGDKDYDRNRFFLNAGWYVIRFSEQQMFLHTNECMKVLYEMLLQEGVIDVLPSSTAQQGPLISHPRWTYKDAIGMKTSKYRNTYLGFNPYPLGIKGYYRNFLLFLPVFISSLTNKELRQEMIRQLKNFF